MSRRDQFTGRGPSSGNTRSHSLASTRRRWDVNLQWATLNIDGKRVRVRVSTKTLKTLRKSQKAQTPVAATAVAAPASVAAPAAPAAPAAKEEVKPVAAPATK